MYLLPFSFVLFLIKRNFNNYTTNVMHQLKVECQLCDKKDVFILIYALKAMYKAKTSRNCYLGRIKNS
ncbi:MAG: hypothetical protein DRI95_12590 [Bacteroidetes bacterium]|nr:MAG: hypothetical protein DRI95_12590 [Bacteroidota bacterium]RLD82296.1 MAG: hypothetical protein DRJ07_08310 [Bacteroidota bacterium]